MMGQQGQIPILVLKEGTQREKGKGAQHNNIQAAKAIADAVRSTLGPKGMDKMLVEVAKTQDEECGDGTTTAVILAGELLKKAEDLINQNVHPTVTMSPSFRTHMWFLSNRRPSGASTTIARFGLAILFPRAM